MKSRLAFLSIGFLAVSAAVGVGCAKDNSVGGDTVTGQGGTSASGQGGQTASGSGGTSANTGMGGSGTLTGTGGSGTGGSGTGGSGATTSGSGGSTGGSITGIAGSGGSGAGAGTNGAGGTTGGGGHGTGGVVGTTGGGGTGPVVIKAGGPSNCAAAMADPNIMATFCDDFEAATTTPGANWTTSGTITVNTDPTKAYRGTKSIMFSNASMAFITETKTFTGTTKATNNEFWGRYFFLPNQTLATYPIGHTVFAALNGGPSDTAGDQFHFIGGSRAQLMAQIRVNNGDHYTDPNGKNGGGTEPSFPAAADGWQCWEWHVQADDSFNFYINGKEITENAIVKGMATYGKMTLSPFPIFASMSLGWQSFTSGGAVISGWIDEVAIGPKQIGCNN